MITDLTSAAAESEEAHVPAPEAPDGGGSGIAAERPRPRDAQAEAPRPGLFEDIPASIWTVFLSGWAGFFLLMWLFFAVGGEATFMVAVALMFGAMAFGLPIVLARQSEATGRRPADLIATRTGPVTVRAAAVQIALIPIAVVVGLLGFILLAKP